MYQRGVAMGEEFRGKGVNIYLGPSVGPLGRKPKGGRNWEGFGSDPVLQGVAGYQTIKGVQEQGVIATIKHIIGNEQEMYRMYNPFQKAYSANIGMRMELLPNSDRFTDIRQMTGHSTNSICGRLPRACEPVSVQS